MHSDSSVDNQNSKASMDKIKGGKGAEVQCGERRMVFFSEEKRGPKAGQEKPGWEEDGAVTPGCSGP